MPSSYPAFGHDISRFAAVVLEIGEFLDRRSENSTALSFRELELLKEGLEYLQLVMTGQEAVQESGASIVAYDDSLSAYQETSKALIWARSPAASPNEKKRLLRTSLTVLSALRDGKALGEIDSVAVQQTRQFFRVLEEYHFSGPFAREDMVGGHFAESLEE